MSPSNKFSNGTAATQRAHNDDPETSPMLPPPAPKDTPIPLRPITILILMRLAEPISFSIIFPFINDMVYHIHPLPDQASVGFYAGIIESLFSVSQMLTILFWGSLSDRIGRKPVLISGLCGSACSSVLFGLSRNFAWAVLARSLAGMTNGNVAIYKSAMGELTDASNQARVFGLFSLMWTVGCLIGPLLGGYLSRPAEQYPGVFGEGKWAGLGGLWIEYPFLLPCLVSACITVASIVLGVVALDETLPAIVERKRIEREQKKRRQHRADDEPLSNGDYGTINTTTTNADARPTTGRSLSSPSISDPPSTPSPGVSIFTLLRIPQIHRVMLSYGFLALIAVALDAVLVLYLYEPASLGGVGFTSDQSGIILSLNGLFGALVQLLLFPPLQKRFGTLWVYRWSMVAFPVSIVLLPLANVIARTTPGPLVWAALLVSTAIRVMGGMAFASNTILVNQCSALTPTQALGTLNSLAQMSSSITRALGPYLANSLFAVSVTQRLLGGQLVWVVLGVVGCVGPVVSLRLADLERDRAEEVEGRS